MFHSILSLVLRQCGVTALLQDPFKKLFCFALLCLTPFGLNGLQSQKISYLSKRSRFQHKQPIFPLNQIFNSPLTLYEFRLDKLPQCKPKEALDLNEWCHRSRRHHFRPFMVMIVMNTQMKDEQLLSCSPILMQVNQVR